MECSTGVTALAQSKLWAWAGPENSNGVISSTAARTARQSVTGVAALLSVGSIDVCGIPAILNGCCCENCEAHLMVNSFGRTSAFSRPWAIPSRSDPMCGSDRVQFCEAHLVLVEPGSFNALRSSTRGHLGISISTTGRWYRLGIRFYRRSLRFVALSSAQLTSRG